MTRGKGGGGLDTPQKWWRHLWTAPNYVRFVKVSSFSLISHMIWGEKNWLFMNIIQILKMRIFIWAQSGCEAYFLLLLKCSAPKSRPMQCCGLARRTQLSLSIWSETKHVDKYTSCALALILREKAARTNKCPTRHLMQPSISTSASVNIADQCFSVLLSTSQ